MFVFTFNYSIWGVSYEVSLQVQKQSSEAKFENT